MKKTEPALTKHELARVCSVLSEFPDIEKAILFGSRAMGRSAAGSDVDIALQGDSLSRKTVTMVSYKLNEELFIPYHFDVLNFMTISNNELLKHIDRVGIVIYPATR
jgi:predicted nucleotidyltransferase